MGDSRKPNSLKGETLRTIDLRGVTDFSRRDFLRTAGVGSAGLITFGGWLVKSVSAQERPAYSLIVVDFNKCTGCRTCEAVCSQANEKVKLDGEELLGLGNPRFSNVRVYSFNPPVEIPNRCVMCGDAPCIEACPVPPDPVTGRKALYRDEKTLAIKNDPERCVACGSCAEVCLDKRVGAIILDPVTSKPGGICNLCEGDPACVKYCPFEALTHVSGGLDGRHYALPPEKVAQELISLWYYHQK